MVDRIKETDAAKLKEEYRRLVEGLKEANIARETDVYLSNPVLPDEILQGLASAEVWQTPNMSDPFIYVFLCLSLSCQRQCPVPFAQQSTLLAFWSDFWSIWNPVWGFNMWSRRARRSFSKTSLRKSASTVSLSGELDDWLIQIIGMWFVFFLTSCLYRFCAERLQSLLRTLEIADIADFSAVTLIASFATLVSTYSQGIKTV